MNKAGKNIISDMFQSSNNFSIIAGPCAIESYEQLEHIAEK